MKDAVGVTIRPRSTAQGVEGGRVDIFPLGGRNELEQHRRTLIAFIRRLTAGDVELAKTEYRERSRKKKTVIPLAGTVKLVGGQQQAYPCELRS